MSASNTVKKIDVLDTNIIVRFFTEDQKQHLIKVRQLFEKAPAQSLFIADAVVAEAVYALSSVYEWDREAIAEALSKFVEYPAFVSNKKVLKQTFALFSTTTLSFIDAYTIAVCEVEKYGTVHTFDKRMKNYPHVKVLG